MSEVDPHRYEGIDDNSDASWYMNGPRPFEAYMSVGTIGEERPAPKQARRGEEVARYVLDGNMSPLYGGENLTDEQKAQVAERNMAVFHESLGLEPGMTRILRPQRDYGVPLRAENVDDFKADPSSTSPQQIDEKADFIYTRSPDVALGVRPADCPVVLATGDTPDGEILAMTHLAWGGAAAGFTRQMFERFDELGIDRSSLRLYITPGGQAENYAYTNAKDDPLEKYPGTEGLFVDVRSHVVDGITKYDYKIDTPHFVYLELLKQGLTPEQIYADTSDTARRDSGYFSHGRAMRSKDTPAEETNGRDIVLAKMNRA